MNWSNGERLYNLLPAAHRARDFAEGEPLRTLLSVIESELETIESDIAGLYDNWFIETCDPWVIPYLADLVGSTTLREAVRPRRADVAKTIYYRRRKATPAMLEELASDVTGWDAHVVEFFQLLAWTQHVNHRRYRRSPNPLFGTRGTFAAGPSPSDSTPKTITGRLDPPTMDRVGTVPVRHLDVLDGLDGAFDVLSHTVDVRPSDAARDRYNLRRLGFFLWRLQSYVMSRAAPVPSSDATDGGTAWGYHVSPLGAPAPLFQWPIPLDPEQGLVSEANVRGPIRPLALHRNLEQCRVEAVNGRPCSSDYIGPERSLRLVVDGTPIDPEKILVMDLQTWHRPPDQVAYQTPDGEEFVRVEAGVDPRLGRVVFPAGGEPTSDTLEVDYTYGFSADLGGGPYRRELEPNGSATGDWAKTVSKHDDSADYPDLAAALSDWRALPGDAGKRAIVTIADNATYKMSGPIELASDQRLAIRAADGRRPFVRMTDGELVVRVDAAAIDSGPSAAVTLEGLLVEGGLTVNGPLRNLTIHHTTLVPGRRLDETGTPEEPKSPSIDVARDNDELELVIDRAITGPLRLPAAMRSLVVRNSILGTAAGSSEPPVAVASGAGEDAYGPTTTFERATVFGDVRVDALSVASEVVFTDAVRVRRRQTGCVRFSYLGPGSHTPEQYRCLRGEERPRPTFTSLRYGDPAYAQLAHHCPDTIRRGAADGAEMGVFHDLRQPQREVNLRQRLGEYLPFGLEPAVVFVT